MIFQVGIWHDITGINFFRNFTETYSEIVESLQNKTLVVTTIMVTRLVKSQLTLPNLFNFVRVLPTACSKNQQRSWWVMMLLKVTP